MPVMVRPECRPSKASAAGAGGAMAQPQESVTPRPCWAPNARPAPPNVRNPLRSMIFLQCGFIYGDTETGSGRQGSESILDLFKGCTGQLGSHAAILSGFRKRDVLDIEVRQGGSQVQGRGGGDGSALMMRSDGDVVGLGHRGNAPGARDAFA